jgi:hypothetical protein
LRIRIEGSGQLLIDGTPAVLVPPDSITDVYAGRHRYTLLPTDSLEVLDTMVTTRPTDSEQPDTLVLRQTKRKPRLVS